MEEEKAFKHLNVPLSSKIETNAGKYRYFGGTAYLGIPQNELFIKNYTEGIKLYGLNNGTSRNNNVQLGIYEESEHFAAIKFGAESALIMSSGYLAAKLTIKKMEVLGKVRYAPDAHPALWQNEKPKTAGTFNIWAKEIVDEINNSGQKEWVLISNSMNNLFPEIYNFSFVQHIDDQKKIFLIIDDSHGIGINNNGSGAFSVAPKYGHVTVLVIASMAKALGVDAGLVLGAKQWIDYLKQSDEFIGASPPAAAGLFAFMQADQIYLNELKKLKDNMLLLDNALKGNGEWHFVKDFPVYLSKNADLSEKLLKQHILISSFPYPDKNGPKLNRIVLTSRHNITEVSELITAL